MRHQRIAVGNSTFIYASGKTVTSYGKIICNMGNENNTVINKIKLTRKQVGNLFIFVGILIITTLEWHFFDWYQATTKYGTLITFAALAGAFFCYVDIKDAVRDKMFWLMAVTDAIALINLFIVGSNNMKRSNRGISSPR